MNQEYDLSRSSMPHNRLNRLNTKKARKKKKLGSILTETVLTIAAWEAGKAMADYYITCTKADAVDGPKDYVSENHLRPRFLK
ncbi:hypothetical protein ERX35_007955 [Macrococcus equipercicus]|uniref:Uncharacterized protein n=1 Tax=Macrococcus equipercicus TaxID=69967 RepID=A0ABQ6R7R1_9STAP|nr:hypothetical protein [Macrococcus equipercicus]KAA1039139.1 hypothetical protein ERX35_007955 [Macrococcus equipercicus]